MEKLQSMNDSRTNQNRTFMLYLATQPLQQLKTFCEILQEEGGNSAHRKLDGHVTCTGAYQVANTTWH